MQFPTEARGVVVVAEERGAVREYVCGLLERALPGVAQVSARSGADALEVLESLATLDPFERGPVVVVSGAHMSDVDGLDVAEQVWDSSSPVSVVLLNGSPSASDRARAQAIEATLIEGPDGFTRLVEIVRELLAHASPTIH